MARERLKFAGDSLAEIQEQAKARANELALGGNSNQDYLRAGFVLLASIVGAALLQVRILLVPCLSRFVHYTKLTCIKPVFPYLYRAVGFTTTNI